MCYEHSLYSLFRENQGLQFDRLDHFKKVQTYNLLFKIHDYFYSLSTFEFIQTSK